MLYEICLQLATSVLLLPWNNCIKSGHDSPFPVKKEVAMIIAGTVLQRVMYQRKFVADGFGAWKSDGCSAYEVLDGSLVTFNCTRLAGYAVLLVCSVLMAASL